MTKDFHFFQQQICLLILTFFGGIWGVFYIEHQISKFGKFSNGHWKMSDFIPIPQKKSQT